MGKTRRIYNNPRLKKTVRNDISYDKIEEMYGKSFEQMTTDEQKEYLNSSLRNAISSHGFIYHPYHSNICMGHCGFCKDHTKDQKHLRKIRKREFDRLKHIECALLSEPALAVDWNKPVEDEAWNDL